MPPPPMPPYETPPPLRNFSHPNCRRVSTITPEQNPKSPAMPRNESRYMLPLPSRIFSNSSSRLDLRSERRAHQNFDFSGGSPHRPGTSYTAMSSFSMPDLTATALPAFPPPAVPAIPHKFDSPAPPHIEPPSPRKLVKSPPRSPAKSAKSGMGSGWRKFKVKVKKAFTFKRQKYSTSTPSAAERGPMVIGSPYNFAHVETHGILPLRDTRPATAPAGDGDENLGDTSAVGRGDLLKNRPGHGTDDESNVRGVGISAAAASWGLGSLDHEGTALEDDADSAWEDYEATRLFTAGYSHD